MGSTVKESGATVGAVESSVSGRPLDRQTGTVSLVAVVKRGGFHGHGYGWQFIMVSGNGPVPLVSTINVGDIDGAMHR